MSKDIIYREDAIDAINLRARIPHDVASAQYASMAINAIRSVPSADRPQGEWKPFDLTWGRSIWYCTACEESTEVPCDIWEHKPIYKYCPNCGARMKGADDDINNV